MYIVVSGRTDRMHEVDRYLYAGQTIVSGVIETRYGSRLVVKSPHGLAGNMLADRLASGLFGARKFETREDVDAYIESDK